MGCYPLFSCNDWTGLAADLELRRSEWVSVALVTDPFGNFDEALLQRTFDRVVPFKEHFVADLSLSMDQLVSKHHQKHARRGLRNVQVDVVDQPLDGLDEWMVLYDVLCERHGISGIRAFSRDSFLAQLQLDGVSVLRARSEGQTVGMQIWLQQGDVVFTHLAAYNELGYKVDASYALHLTATEYFQKHAKWLGLGAGAGSGASSQGLSEYKHGWSTGTRQAYFCGKVLQPERYDSLIAAVSSEPSTYFPAYRAGEF